jgi:hypothetical protein
MTSAAATNQIEDAARLDDDPAWPRAAGLRYLRMLYRMHGALAPDWYLEVGTATGKSLKLANRNAIAIDPAFNLKEDVLRGRRQTHMFQETSDAFFASAVARHLAPRIDLAFLDGMHLFEFLVRDFMQTEALCGRDSVITMHEVVPITPVAAERTWDKTRTGAWTGDVWKIVPILRRYRPDLDLRVADCAPSGLAIVTNLDPGNTVLADNYDRIVAEYRDMSLADFGVARLAESLDLEPAEGPALARFAGGQVESPAVRPARSFALKVQAPNTARAPFWGEFHLASGLASAFRRLGIEAEVQTLDRWNRTRPGQADLALWGLKQPFEHAANRWSGVWLLYGANRAEEENLSQASHVFVASSKAAPAVAEAYPETSVTTLLQAFDADRMSPDGPVEPSGLLYPANGVRARLRATARHAIAHGVALDIHGERWDGTEVAQWLRSVRIPNERIARFYRGARAVMNDHKNGMGADGFVSNRIFDVLACGTPVISDRVAAMPRDLTPWVAAWTSGADFPEVVAGVLSEPPERSIERRSFALDIVATHSLDARAAQILEVMQ